MCVTCIAATHFVELLVSGSSNMGAASIEIPGSVICDEIYEYDPEYYDDYFGYYEDYYYDDPCYGSGDCSEDDYYDLTLLFGNCSRVLNIAPGIIGASLSEPHTSREYVILSG